MLSATSSLRRLHGSMGAVPSMSEKRLVETIITALRKEKVLDREGGILDDECIVHPRSGDEEIFNDLSDFIDSLRGYVIIPVEEYSKLGGHERR